MKTTIAASILAADFSILGKEVNDVKAAGAGSIHFDVMDHHFVPNLSFGACVCSSLTKAGIDMFIDAHLMVEKPELYIEAFAKAGAHQLTFHPETTSSVEKTIDAILESGMQAGLAFNPEHPLDIPFKLFDKLSLILIMSVHPGFGGQSFMPEVLPKVTQARQLVNEYNPKIHVAIDGGINLETIGQAAQAGADYFVTGSALFGADDYAERIKQFNAILTA